MFGRLFAYLVRIWSVFGFVFGFVSGFASGSYLVRIWFVSDLDLIRVWVGSNSYLS